MRCHIANTDFEFELAHLSGASLKQNPIVHQLQFLPFLYKDEGDIVCVTDMPIDGSPCHLLTDPLPLHTKVESWGASQNIAQWASQHHLIYHMPPWDVVREVNSKAFSFQQTPPLPHAQLIFSWGALEEWLQRMQGPAVLKSCFGLSGQGHLLLPASPEKIRAFAEREFHASRPLIAEPWVERKLDFSTQWVIQQDASISYVGATLLLSDAKGRYTGTLVGDEKKLFGSYFSHVQQHKEVAVSVLKKMSCLGFFGNVGIDAMVWGSDILHPIVEINARKTMGWVALQIGKRLFPNQTIKVSYEAASRPTPLLPQGIIKASGEVEMFRRNLFVGALV
jgi:hypothetical protein